MKGTPTAPPLLVALDLPLRAGDAAFTFGAGAAPGARRGTGVVVPFGRRLLPGIVLGEGIPRPDLRPVLAVIDRAPLVPPATVDLAEWVAREYLSSIGEALAVALPWDALWASVRLHVSPTIPPGVPEPATVALAAMRRRPPTLARAGRLLAALAATGALGLVAEARVLGGVLAPAHAPARARGTAIHPTPIPPPVPESRGAAAAGAGRLEEAVRGALAGGPRAMLVAGWHRTPAYLAAIRGAQAAGRSCVAAFASVGAAAAFAAAAQAAGLAPVLQHADLRPADRLAAWRSVIDAAGTLVVGTRGTMFAPVRDPVLAIVDDEDGSGHKEDRAPRYLTRAVAAERTRAAGILIIGATTPTVATYAGTADGSLRLIALPSPRPRIGVIDLRRRSDPDQPVSRPVLDAVRRTVRSRGRAILVTDRKGYAGGLHCRGCGAVERCPQCGVAMRYERERRRLRCRFCGRTAPAPGVCSRCGGATLAPLGAGTERIAAAVRRLTPAVWRLDSDVLTHGGDVAGLLGPFRERGGVLVATPMVLPWIATLHPDVVAIVAADRLLHRPEFRASERALALLRSVGIASRTTVLVETADPAHPAISAAVAPSLRPFYADELAQRQALGYPPYRSVLVVTVTARSPQAADAIYARLAAAASPALDVLGPVILQGPAQGRSVQREIVLKAADRAAARALVLPLLTGTGIPRGVRVVADVDPHDL